MLQLAYFVPVFDIEAKINVEVLMVIVMEDAIRLPRLPPMTLEGDAGMINDAMVIGVQ